MMALMVENVSVNKQMRELFLQIICFQHELLSLLSEKTETSEVYFLFLMTNACFLKVGIQDASFNPGDSCQLPSPKHQMYILYV